MGLLYNNGVTDYFFKTEGTVDDLKENLDGLTCSHLALRIIWLLSLGWLISRAILLLCKSRTELLESLGVIEPVTPEVVVDRLGDTWASIHWSYTNQPNTNNSQPNSQGGAAQFRTRRPKIKRHAVCFGEKTVDVPGDHRRLILTDLIPNTKYELTVQPIYMGSKEPLFLQSSSGKSSQGGSAVHGSVHFHTLSSSADRLLPLNSILNCPLPEFSQELLRGCFDSSHEKPDELYTNAETILKIQRETHDMFTQYTESEHQFALKNNALMATLSELQALRRSDEAQRSQLRTENKNLEDDDHALEVQVHKLKLQAAKVARYKADSEQNILKVTALDRAQSEEEAENDRILDQLNRQLSELHAHESALQEELKDTVQNCKEQDSINEKVRVLIGKLRNLSQASTEVKLSLLHSEDAKILRDSEKQILIREIQLDGHIEWEWARAQKSLEQQYVEAYLRNSEHKAQLRVQKEYRLGQQQAHHDVTADTLTASPPFNGLSSSVGNHSMNQLIGSSAINSAAMLNGNAMSSPLMQSAMGSSSSQVLHSAPSFASLSSLGSIPSVQRLPSSSVQSLGTIQSSSMDAFGMQPSLHSTTPPHYHSNSSVTSARPSLDGDRAHHEEAVISSKTAHDLLPSNLFQDAALGGSNRRSSDPPTSDLHVEETRNGIATSNIDTADVATPKKKSGGSQEPPNILSRVGSPHRPSGRTTSLFFNSHDETSEVFAPDAVLEEEEEGAENSSSSRSPLRGMGSRFFQKGSNRSGSFVRRLSLFSRKDSEPSSTGVENS